jgi:hypothetical protein
MPPYVLLFIQWNMNCPYFYMMVANFIYNATMYNPGHWIDASDSDDSNIEMELAHAATVIIAQAMAICKK